MAGAAAAAATGGTAGPESLAATPAMTGPPCEMFLLESSSSPAASKALSLSRRGHLPPMLQWYAPSLVLLALGIVEPLVCL